MRLRWEAPSTGGAGNSPTNSSSKGSIFSTPHLTREERKEKGKSSED